MLKRLQKQTLLLAQRARRHYDAAVFDSYAFHNLSHTERVVNQVERFVDVYQIDAVDACYLTAAAWLHDVGYDKGAAGHEERSRQLAMLWCDEIDYPADGRAIIGDIILSTQLPQMPSSLLQCCICDADLEHLYQGDYFTVVEYLKEEWAASDVADQKKDDYLNRQIEFLSQHTFKTDYAQYHYQRLKDEILSALAHQSKQHANE